ncbi:MAG TPA: disulfide bond formation protein B [Ilumatobacteraceae bacterium]|nr:disulfide bond formation protein B [Ilumatobacteraceae bacterium]
MSPTAVHDVGALLALIALGGVVLMIAARIIPSVAAVRFLHVLHDMQLQLAALVATTATLGSFYFSEFGAHWVPCRFCWFQRVFMYSLAVVLIVAAVRRDRGARWYAGVLATIGLLISLWHNLLERGVVEESAVCSTTVPCATPWYMSFGHYNDMGRPAGFPSVTLAVMAFCGFAAILALLFIPESLEDDPNGEPAEG